ncbi:hypothetical protein ACLSYX_00475 [[Pasteurella] aerogenes]
MKFKKLILLTIGFSISNMALAEWIYMTVISEDWNKGSFGKPWITCRYESAALFSSGEQITIRVSDSSCPYSIEYNPETNKWRR